MIKQKILGSLVAVECTACNGEKGGKGGLKRGSGYWWNSCDKCQGKGWEIGYISNGSEEE